MDKKLFELWNVWDEQIHNDIDQRKRQSSACSSKCTPLNICDGVGTFSGSKSNYTTSLSACTCIDFNRRKLPCKHMYRLAHETGLFLLAEEVASDSNISFQIKADDAMEIVNKLDKDTMCYFADICYYLGNNNSVGWCSAHKDSPYPAILFSLNLIEEYYGLDAILYQYKMNELRSFCKEYIDVPLPRKKDDLIVFMLENLSDKVAQLPDDCVHFRLSKSITHLASTIHRRVRKKYPQDPMEWYNNQKY